MRLTSACGSMLKNTSGTALRAARSSRCACPAPRARSSRLKSMSPAHATSSSPRSAAEACGSNSVPGHWPPKNQTCTRCLLSLGHHRKIWLSSLVRATPGKPSTLARIWPEPPDSGRAAHQKKALKSWKGKVCKTFIRRFDSDPRLEFFPVLHPDRQSTSLKEGAVNSSTPSSGRLPNRTKNGVSFTPEREEQDFDRSILTACHKDPFQNRH